MSPINKPKELITIFIRKITESPSRFIIDRLMSKKLKIKKVTIAAMTLPIAKPTWPKPNLKAKSQLKITFRIKDTRATYIGVLGSCLAKKPTLRIFIAIKAINPKQNAFRL